MNSTLWPATPATNTEAADTSDDTLRQCENNRGEPAPNIHTPEQLAALWLRLDGQRANATLKALGEPGNWSIALSYDEPATKRYTIAWLSSARKPSEIRVFKTLDAAYNAAHHLCTIVNPALRYPSNWATLQISSRTHGQHGIHA